MNFEDLGILEMLDNGDDVLYQDVLFAKYLIKSYKKEALDVPILTYWSIDELRRKDIVGEKLYKLWESCEKNITYFEKTVLLLTKVFQKLEIHTNLSLENPVTFFQKEKLMKVKASLLLCNELDYQEEINAFQKDFVKRVNVEIEKEGKDTFLKERDVHETWNSYFEPSEKIEYDSIYVGRSMEEITLFPGCFNCKESFVIFEKQKQPFRYYNSIFDVYRSLPDGRFVFSSGNQEILMHEEIAYQNQIIYSEDDISHQFYLVSIPSLIDTFQYQLKHDILLDDEDLSGKRYLKQQLFNLERLNDENGEVCVNDIVNEYHTLVLLYESCFGEELRRLSFNISKYQKKIPRKYH
ncbi:MAG: hypothetical protein KH135_05625 [Firmicutes bacterium]|nr:hypothetical protein [Bacillota bacterium]